MKLLLSALLFVALAGCRDANRVVGPLGPAPLAVLGRYNLAELTWVVDGDTARPSAASGAYFTFERNGHFAGRALLIVTWRGAEYTPTGSRDTVAYAGTYKLEDEILTLRAEAGRGLNTFFDELPYLVTDRGKVFRWDYSGYTLVRIVFRQVDS